ncbi:cucumber peeling cupredoxin-like isoform X2 [Camellia sinensis]|uniref:cucumber peeling cupredoxin-like isoform X2 n=1 Tax=Camellia sinensis TaxID=4442 RepID=UPI001036353F|nr:cucumber peeling cupredoxin-like isoform X2 [Camellia sinensis]
MATAKLSFTKLVVLALAAAVLVEFSAAAAYIVGDTMGWVNPSSDATVYSKWASQHTFATGDILVFNYATGQHNVARVSKNAYDTCNPTSPMSIDTNGPTNINLNTTGEYYFFCTVGTHCTQGQKLAINVTSPTTAPSGAPSSPPTTSPSPASPPPSPTASPPSPTASPPPSTTAPPPSPTASPPPSTTAPPPSSTASPPPPSAPSPGSPGTSASPPPPPASSAPPTAVAAFAVVLMSIAIGVMC